jgi:hypothetical protein
MLKMSHLSLFELSGSRNHLGPSSNFWTGPRGALTPKVVGSRVAASCLLDDVPNHIGITIVSSVRPRSRNARRSKQSCYTPIRSGVCFGLPSPAARWATK